MNQRHQLIEALMHLEYIATGGKDINVQDRAWAALYLVQAALYGKTPDNFEEVMTPARAHDAAMMVEAMVADAKRLSA